ncbi:MAG: 5'/3'-nucleotidase SurE [Desulfobacterales bacterium C00003060]|nr:MAG: 5'/3'-nucleotidase SurE [Desulfobacterales bacterium S3730MH5]OEU79846.1 MAG: 5'/3'-nucleotidase SurE [Desulfobacterales bacterium S5133MH4]OEU80069.1 MAG: 5'/3'-nucleotidase SurE [Desulfobacterales bacterium C00003060]
MNILLTNDDGIHAEGLWALEKALSDEHRTTVVAPDTERSATGHSITLLHPLRVNRIQTNGGSGHAVSGTPADCVKLAVLELMEARPDMVVSGINPGPNVGFNLNYSGTVSAAKEAALMGMPAIAVSQTPNPDNEYRVAADFVGILIDKIIENGLPLGTFLNVNVPACPAGQIEGVRITRQGVSRLKEMFHRRTDPRAQTYYWQGVETQIFDQDVDTDGAALSRNCISITPVQCDMTDHQALEHLKSWDINLK